MVTVQVAVLPDLVARADAVSTTVPTLSPVTSSSDEQEISYVAGMLEATVIVKLMVYVPVVGVVAADILAAKSRVQVKPRSGVVSFILLSPKGVTGSFEHGYSLSFLQVLGSSQSRLSRQNVPVTFTVVVVPVAGTPVV
jgi:hypothetical protein